MKSYLISLLIVLMWFASNQSWALNVDKMIIFSKKDQESVVLKVSNPATHPVMFRVELAERDEEGGVTPLALEDFEQWPAFIDRTEYFIDPKGEVEVNVRLVNKMLGNKINEDIILAIDITPESINIDSEEEKTTDNMAILMGYRTWLVIPKEGNVSGGVSVEKENGKYVVENKMDTVVFLNINACDTEFAKDTKCSGSEWVLAGKKKTLNFDSFNNGVIKINVRDTHDRFKDSLEIKL
ncbi:hypothetical protein ACPSL3_07660 [Vibrio owensii]|uniref:hypothetical protein n=1 Tax=Vibrio owensii TaxID=696485 RepID=UPI003CE4EE01